MRSRTRTRSCNSAICLACCGSLLPRSATPAAMRFSSICARLLTQTIPTIIMKGANGASQNPSISNISPQRDLSAQAFDLGRQPRVVGHVVALDLGEPAVDVAEPGADFACGARRALADPLPVLLLVAV